MTEAGSSSAASVPRTQQQQEVSSASPTFRSQRATRPMAPFPLNVLRGGVPLHYLPRQSMADVVRAFDDVVVEAARPSMLEEDVTVVVRQAAAQLREALHHHNNVLTFAETHARPSMEVMSTCLFRPVHQAVQQVQQLCTPYLPEMGSIRSTQAGASSSSAGISPTSPAPLLSPSQQHLRGLQMLASFLLWLEVRARVGAYFYRMQNHLGHVFLRGGEDEDEDGQRWRQRLLYAGDVLAIYAAQRYENGLRFGGVAGQRMSGVSDSAVAGQRRVEVMPPTNHVRINAMLQSVERMASIATRMNASGPLATLTSHFRDLLHVFVANVQPKLVAETEAHNNNNHDDDDGVVVGEGDEAEDTSNNNNNNMVSSIAPQSSVVRPTSTHGTLKSTAARFEAFGELVLEREPAEGLITPVLAMIVDLLRRTTEVVVMVARCIVEEPNNTSVMMKVADERASSASRVRNALGGFEVALLQLRAECRLAVQRSATHKAAGGTVGVDGGRMLRGWAGSECQRWAQHLANIIATLRVLPEEVCGQTTVHG